MQDLIEKHLAALDRAPADEAPFRELENLLSGASRWDELLKLYEQRARLFPDAAAAPTLLVRAADLVRTRLNNPARAEELYHRALVARRNEPAALEGLKVLYESKGDLASLAAVLMRRAQAAQGADAASILLELGNVWEKLGKIDRAVLAWQKATKADPACRGAYEKLLAALMDQARYALAADVADQLKEKLGADGMAERYVAIAEKLADAPHEQALAQRAIAAALALEPGNARAQAAKKALESLAQTWKEKAKALRLAANDERDRKKMAGQFLAVAMLHAAYDAPEEGQKKAREFIDRALVAWPGMPQALDALERLGGDDKALVAALEKLAGESRDRLAQVEVLMRLANLKIGKLNDREGGLATLTKAIALDASRAEAVGLAVDFLLDENRPQEVVALLERHLATLPDKLAQVAMHLRVAELADSQLKNPAAAKTHLEAALQIDPTCLEAATRLLPLYEAAGEPETLAKALELVVQAEPDAAKKLVGLRRLADLYGGRLGRSADALHALSRALLLDPPNAGLIQALEAAAAQAGKWNEAVRALRIASDVAAGPAKVALLRRAAELSDQPLGKLDESRALYQRVLELAPDDPAARAAVESLLSRTGAHQELAKGYEQQLAAAATAEGKKEILLKMSAALEQSGSDPRGALEVYRRILEIAPDDVETLKRLGAACAALEQWDEVAKVATRLAEHCPPEEAREWRTRRAQVLADRLGQKEEAAEAYLALLSEEPGKPALLTALEKIASGGVLAKRIAEATLPSYLKAADHVRAAQALQTLVAGTDDPAKRLPLMHQLAQILEDKLADRRGAFSVMEQALRLQPGDAKVRAELERLAKDLSAHAELAALLMEIADRLADPAVQLDLLLRAGALAEAGGDAELAIQALDLALALPGGHAEAPKALQRVAVRAERWADAERALKVRLQDEAEKAPLLVDLAKVCDRQGRQADAAAALEQGLAAGAGAAELLPHLSRLYEAAKDLRGLESSLSRELALAEKAGDKEKTARLRLRVSKLQERSGGDRGKAVANYAAVLAERPSDPEALGALEKMLQNPELREVAAKALVPAYEATKEFRKLVFALEVLAEAATEAVEKVSVLKRIAQVHAVDLRHPPLAFATLARALRITPADAQLRVATRKAAEDADSMDAYAEILAESASASQGAAAIPLFRELAEVSERKLGNREQAIAYLARILEIDAENIDGLRGLHRLHRLSEAWQELAVICRRLARVIFDEHERSALYREAGTLFEGTLKRPDEAAECFRALSESDPLDRDSALALDRLYTGLQRPQDLAFALELRRSQEAGNAAGREAAFRLAELKRNVLNDPAGALQLFGAVLSEDPNHANARATLETWAKSGGPGSAEATTLIDPALERAGEHARRVTLREAALSQATPDEKARLWAEIRKINELDMGRPELAFMAACRAFAEDVDREHVGPELERLARATDSWEELADVYEQVAENSMPGDEVGLYCLRRAAQLRAHLGEAERAIGLWKNLLQEVPSDREALEALAKLHEHSQNARELSEVYKQQAALAQDPAQRAALLLQAGTAKAQSGDDAAAVELGRAALVLNPKSRGALELLDKVYERTKKDHERADVLRLLADLTEDIVARRATLMKRAQLLEDQGELSEAVEAYARVLTENAGESAAVAGLERLFQKEQAKAMVARVLEPFYRSINDARHLADVLEVRAAQSEKGERQVVLFEIARLRESLGQRPMAFAAMLRCFRDDPHDVSIREELERLAAETGSFEELAAAYEDELEHEKDEGVQLELWRRLGSLYGDRLGQPDRAAQAWEEVYRRAPEDTSVLDTLSRIYRRTSSLRELVAVLWRQVAMQQDPVKRREHLVEIASLCEEKLGDRDAAAAAWKEIRRLKEDDSQALAALQRLLAECSRFEELSELLSWLADQAVAQDKLEESLELKVALGRLKLTKLSEPREALTMFQEVVGKRPGHAGAVAAMEQMARGEGGLKAEAAMALEPVFAQGGDYLKLVQMLEARAQAAAPVEKATLLRRIAELYAGPLDSVEMAYVWAARALETLPDDPESLAAVLKYAKPAGAEEECASLLTEEVEKARSDEARVALQRALANLLARQGEAEQAVLAFRRLLELAPGDPEALDGLAAFYRDGGQWADLLEVLRRQLATAPDGANRAELMRRIGELQDEKVGDKTGAIATFRRLLEIVPDDAHSIERLDKLCQSEERWAELADVLNREIVIAERQGKREQALTLKFRLAQVREQRLLDRSGAMTLYREVLQMRPGHVETIARLEVVFSKEPTYDEAADLLADAYRTVNNHGKLAKLLEDRAAAGIDQSSRKKHLGELAKIRGQHQERPDLAFIALCKAFREDPGDPATRQALEVTADQAETHEELAGIYEEELPRLDGRDAAEVCLKLGQLYEHKLSESELAINYYEKARAFDPSVSRAALPALDRLYKDAEDWGKLAEILSALVALTEEGGERTALLFRLGQLAEEKLDPPSPDRAARAYEQILETDPNHLPAARSLERLYETAKRYDRLYQTLELQQKLVTGSEKERITARMAEVAVNGLKDIERAIALYNDVLGLNPRSEAAFLALEGLYEDSGNLETLVELLRRRLTITVDPREITRLSDKVGRVLGSLNRDQEAIAAFRAALERDPRHKKALESLRTIYEKYAPSEDLVTVLRRLIPLQDDADGVKKVRLRLAEALSAMGKRDEAIEAARRVLDVEPHKADDLLRAEELFRSLKAHADQVRAMEPRAQLAAEAGDIPQATSILYSVAEVYTNALKKREAAAPAYERLLEIAPGERLAFDALREIYSGQVDWRRYANACERFIPGAQSPEERVEILKDLGSVQEVKLGHKDLAFLSFCRAMPDAPADEQIQQAVTRLAEETGSWEELATVYEDLVEKVAKGPLAERLYLELAKVHDAHLDQPEEAEASLRKVLEFDPANHSALDALAQMFSRRGKDTEYVVSLEQKYEAAASIEERKAILKEIALTYQLRLLKPEEAATAYLRSLELEPDRETFRTLIDLYRAEKRWIPVTDVLIRARDFESDPAVRAQLQVEVSDVYEREIQDDEAAVSGYTQALEFDPANREALNALERLYTKLDRAAELLGVYDAQLRAADTRERVKILFKTSGIWEDKYQNLENADACLEAVLAVDPDNLQAIKGLERLRRADAEAKRPAVARWEDLLRAYERHLSLAPDLTEQVELLVLAGEVYYHELKRIDRAAQIFNQALEINPRSREAMHALGILFERSGNWPFALDMLSKEAELLGANKEAVELFHRIGKINEEMLLDPVASKAAYHNALSLDAGYLPSLRCLKGIYEFEKDWDNYLQVIIQEAEHTVDVEERAQAWLVVAHFYQDSKEDRDSAGKYYEEALKLLPTSMEAARPLADIYVAREDWEHAEQMLDIVSKNLAEGAARDPQVGIDLCRQLYRLGYVCEKMKKVDRALSAYEKAYGLDSTYLPSAEGYANLLVATSKNSEALQVYQAILIHHREDLTDLEVVEYYWQVGDLYRKLGQAERAKKEFDKALAIDSNHEPSLRSEIDLAEEIKDWEAAIDHRGRLAGLVEDAARFELYTSIGWLAREKIKDAYRAIDAYVMALELKADAPDVHEALLSLYRETRQANKAVETGERMLALPEVKSDVAKARKLWMALGEVCRDELKDIPRAADAFNKALDLDFRFIQAFSSLEAMLGQNRQWDQLEQNYVRMIQRLPKTDDTNAARMTLWRTLADFYEKVKKDKKSTKAAYQVVIRGNPDDTAALEKFAELAGDEDGSEKEALDAWRKALNTTERPQKVVNQLVRLSAKLKDYDGAYVAAQVGAHLVGESGPDEREILTKLTPYAKRKEQASKQLTGNLWTSLLYHPKVRGPMGDILALVYEKLGSFYGKKHGVFGVDAHKDRVDLDSSLELAVQNYKYIVKVLDMEALALYSPFLIHTRERLKQKGAGLTPPPDKELLLEILHTHPVSLKAGGKLFGEQAPKELFFFLAKTMAFARPELALARLLPAEKLDAVFQAAVITGVPSFRASADPRAIEAELRVIERLEPQFRSTLARLGREYARVATGTDIRNFIEGAELTANRVGALLATDLEAVKNALGKDQGAAAKLPLRARIRDLMLFCLSKEYLDLRNALGLKIEIKLPGAR